MTLFAISVMNAHGRFRATLSHNIDNYLPVKRIRECYRRGQCGEGGDYPYAAHSPTASNPFAVTWPSPVSLRLSLREAYIVDLLAFNLNSSRITPPPCSRPFWSLHERDASVNLRGPGRRLSKPLAGEAFGVSGEEKPLLSHSAGHRQASANPVVALALFIFSLKSKRHVASRPIFQP